jgi:flagellar biosynthesis/type III secretory pathway chaperone
MGLTQLSNVLWREREMLEVLLFKLEEEQLLLAAGRSRWIARATHEVEVVLEAIGKTELLRATEVEAVSREMGLRPDTSLRELAERAPSPWDDILREHREKFLEITAEISDLAAHNRELVTVGQRAAQAALRALDGVNGDETFYGRGGTAEAVHVRSRLLDGAL